MRMEMYLAVYLYSYGSQLLSLPLMHCVIFIPFFFFVCHYSTLHRTHVSEIEINILKGDFKNTLH